MTTTRQQVAGERTKDIIQKEGQTTSEKPFEETFVGLPAQVETDENGVDYGVKSHVQIKDNRDRPMDAGKFDALCKMSYKACRVDEVVFCNESRTPKTRFRPTENIYALVTFQNTSGDYALIACWPGTFGQDGIYLEISGHPMHRITETKGWVPPVTPIPPGKSYTFFRKFSVVAPIEPTRDCFLYTPKLPDNYDVVVKYVPRDMSSPLFVYSGSFELSIRK
jgi:hypothetical protein